MDKWIALTFDDGPNTTTTMDILDLLEENGIVASFFLIGQNINSESRKAVQRAVNLGCEICNHSYSHPAFSSLSEEEMKEELRRTSLQILEITGSEPKFFRPPYIAVDHRTAEVSDPMTMICGYGCEDWEDSVSASQRVSKVLGDARNGNVILLHDMEGNYRTVEAVREIIPALKAQGYHFITISKLFEKCEVIPRKGVLYSNAFQNTRYPWGDELER